MSSEPLTDFVVTPVRPTRHYGTPEIATANAMDSYGRRLRYASLPRPFRRIRMGSAGNFKIANVP